MVDEFENHDDPIRAFMDNRVEHPPEGRQVLDEQTLYPIPLDQNTGYGLLPNDLPLEAIVEQDLPQITSFAGDALCGFFRRRIERPQRLSGGWGDQNLLCTRFAQRRTPLRMISRS
ncbi:MAG: hypothetical protein L3K23_06640 [Thermoplasmata archaeon]|nr:hypothetical protein [Thermoplasmata archaeon]